MALIVKYKFQNVDANGNSISLLPQFPSDVSYTNTDVVEGNITTRVIETDDLSKVTYIRFGCGENTYVAGAWEYLTEILDINLSYVNTFYRMFRGCNLLTSLDVSNWDTSKITSMNSMFSNCSQLTQLDVSNWNTSNVTDMSILFNNCSSLTSLDVSNWDTSNVTIMTNVFNNCSALTSLDVSNWDTSNVTDMVNMFRSCQSLTSLDVSNWDTSNVTDMTNMFNNCGVKNVGLIYCSKDTVDTLANCITSPCNFYVTNKTYTSPNPLVKYIMYREDKKPLLYYNDETQTWEKPVLREWDSIEKHSDGKYYYHKRSGEVVLNGSEAWADRSSSYVSDTQTRFSTSFSAKPCSNTVTTIICDKYRATRASAGVASVSDNGICIIRTGTTIYITVPKTTLQEFKTTLQANPATVAYQLAEEKVYECTDLDLITYSGETNLLIKSGVLNPKVTLKIHQNIANIVTILQNKVSVLENVFIQGLKQVLAGDMQSLAYTLYPEDFENIEQQNDPTDE